MSSIWFKPYTVEEITQTMIEMRESGGETITDHLGIEIIEIGEDFLCGRMPVDARTKNVLGIMHGGSSCVLAESLGSLGSVLCIDTSLFNQVGLDIHTTHIHSVSSGFVIGTARPLHIGRSTHVWEIKITDENNKLISATRFTTFIKKNKETKDIRHIVVDKKESARP